MQLWDVVGTAEYRHNLCCSSHIIVTNWVVCSTNIVIKYIIGSTVIIPSVPQYHSLHIPGCVDPCLPLCQHRAWGWSGIDNGNDFFFVFFDSVSCNATWTVGIKSLTLWCCMFSVIYNIVVEWVPYWKIKMGGLVTPPGGAEGPQFPTRPCNYKYKYE